MLLGRALIILIAITAAAYGSDGSPTQPTAPPPSFGLSGVVRENLPGGLPGLPIRGVKVETPAGTSTTTGDDGRYTIAAASGSFDLKFSKDGYTSTAVRVEGLSGNREIDAALSPILRTLTGLVIDASLNTPVIAARLEILNGSNKGRSVATDMDGEYRFANVWGDFDLSASAVGYESKTVRAAVDVMETRVDLRLDADGLVARSVFTGALCTVAPPYSYSLCQGTVFPYPVQAHHWFTVARPGSMALAVSYVYVGDYYWNYLSVELRCEGQLITEKRADLLSYGPPVIRPDNVTGPVPIMLPRPCNYELTLSNYISDRKGGDWTTYRVEVGYPR